MSIGEKKFQAETTTLNMLKQLLRDVHVGDDKVQKRVSVELGRVSEHNDFVRYCACVLGDTSEEINVRYTAGICMKSVLGRGECDPFGAEENLFSCFGDPNELVRKASKLALVSMVTRIGILQSEKILMFFVQCIK